MIKMKKYETGQGQLDRRKTEIRGIRQRKGANLGWNMRVRERNRSKIPKRFLPGWLGSTVPLPMNKVEETEIIGWQWEKLGIRAWEQWKKKKKDWDNMIGVNLRSIKKQCLSSTGNLAKVREQEFILESICCYVASSRNAQGHREEK